MRGLVDCASTAVRPTRKAILRSGWPGTEPMWVASDLHSEQGRRGRSKRLGWANRIHGSSAQRCAPPLGGLGLSLVVRVDLRAGESPTRCGVGVERAVRPATARSWIRVGTAIESKGRSGWETAPWGRFLVPPATHVSAAFRSNGARPQRRSVSSPLSGRTLRLKRVNSAAGLAGLTVFDRALETPDHILRREVLTTVVSGRVVYESNHRLRDDARLRALAI